MATVTDKDDAAPTTQAGNGEHDDVPGHGLVARLATAGRAALGRRAPASVPYRLRDLSRRGQLWAAAFAVALVLAPVQAFIHVVRDWVPSNDPALIGIQSLEVGTKHTPLTGQPSTSAHYVEADRHVDHLGPLHNYLLAGPMRILGPAVGMLSVSVLIISACALLMAWAFFRRLGPTGGIVGAALVGLLMFTTGASTLMTPVSSNMAGYPLSCSAVLLWCVMRGDLRLLPVATAVTTFAAQQHLSVVPAVAVLVPVALTGLLWHWGRDSSDGEGSAGWSDLRTAGRRLRERGVRGLPAPLLAWVGVAGVSGLALWWAQIALRQHSALAQLVGAMGGALFAGVLLWRTHLALRPRYTALAQLVRWAGTAAVIGLLLWSPMLAQEVRTDPGNLSNLVDLTRDDDRPTVGIGSAVIQVTHVVGLPPLLGRTDLHSNSAIELYRSPSVLTAGSAAAIVAVLGLLAVRWHRRAPEKQSLVIWVGALMVVGLVNGSSVLDSIEQWRMVLHHWIWPLTLFVAVALVLGAIDGLRALASARSPLRRTRVTSDLLQAVSPAARPALGTVALLVVAVPALVNPTLDRPSNELGQFRSAIERRYIEETVQQVLEHRDLLDEPIVMLSRGAQGFTNARESLTLYLIDEGIDARLPRHARHFVANRRLAGDDHSTSALLVVHDHDPNLIEVDTGTLVADVTTVDGLDSTAYDAAVSAFEAVDTLALGPALEQVVAAAPIDWQEAAVEGTLDDIELVPDGEEMSLAEFQALGGLQVLNRLQTTPQAALTDPNVVDFLVEHPPDDPQLDPGLLERLQAYDHRDQPLHRPLRIRVFLLEGEELAEVGFPRDRFM